jgi:hypothetical protein
MDNTFQQGFRGPSYYAQHLGLQGMALAIPTTVSGFGTLGSDSTTNSQGMEPTIPTTVRAFDTLGIDSKRQILSDTKFSKHELQLQ